MFKAVLLLLVLGSGLVLSACNDDDNETNNTVTSSCKVHCAP
ncbi:hypothetical protein [Acinetobacter rudis]|uniref:Lipoprotein n=1 Tax=Acinetobacter rudis TaxID=632955 RepID=A0AAW8J9T1_9GAMM|nr:hypothetical protein [Acinetobacter rudis]MDQ8935906.1 hypothetical protein [Acinetobacter rudis]MDQ8953649.1 hypothetical protein [Acinetobacter rudis]MDQ9018169.1 hypothetical protein [Acinetobacter rudis]